METNNNRKAGYPSTDITKSRYVRLQSDAGFKAVFGDPANKNLLIRFLNMFLSEDRQVADITEYMDREDDGPGEPYRGFRCDLKCRTEDGSIFIIEMQKELHDNFFQRCVYYGARTYGRELRPSEFYTMLHPVVVFAVLGERYPHVDESLWENNKDLVARYEFIETRTGEFAPSSISTIFVELARFTKTDRSEFKGEYDILFYLLKHIHEMSEVPEDLKVGINRDLVEASEIAAFDGVKREQYEAKIMTELDYRYLDYYHSKKAREEGKAEGERIGEARGKAEGKAESIHKVARNMLSLGCEVQLICECTGLTEDEIRALK